MIRVAALQFAPVADADENLAALLARIDALVPARQPQLLVLPEFSNHPSLYEGPGAARSRAAAWDGPFLVGLRDACSRHALHLVVGVSMLSEQELVTSSALLIGPAGELLSRADRQVLTPELASSYAAGTRAPEVVETRLGRLGMCVGRDAGAMETTRLLALSGAQLVCACFGPESARDVALHVAARAAENRVFVVAATPPAGGAAALSAQALECSQIVAPDGTARAVATAHDAASVVAELDASEADHKLRADGTHVFGLRRPELYRPLTFRPRLEDDRPFESVDVALLSNVDAGSVEGAIESAACFVRDLAAQGAALIGLPELFCFEHGLVEDAAAAAAWFVPAVRRLAEACAGHATHVVTSLVERTDGVFRHTGLVIGHAGLVMRAPQLHVPARHAWATPAGRLQVVPLPWGKLGVLVGEDAIVPEATRALALLGADLLLVAGAAGEPWEAAVGASALALENDLGVAVALRETESGGSMLVDGLQRSGPLRAVKGQALLFAALSRPRERLQLRERPQRLASELVARS
jgi:deaminated glutathione amidase